tara:strand:- start:15946 stop:18186 length:2241 start_codon:yes stop_codon:yes gene_type:complete
MAEAKKAKVTLGGEVLAASSNITWSFVTGVQPYRTIFTVHKDAWQKLKGKKGQPLTLKIVDGRGVTTEIEQVFIMHEAPSDAPAHRSFVVADRRWKWAHELVVRDYNMPRKTGDRTAFGTVPATQSVTDQYDYLPYSLKGEQGERWTAQAAVEDVLEQIEEAAGGDYKIESFPIKDTSGGDSGQFTMQGVTLRDSGEVALARLLGYVPGAEVYIDAKGVAVVIDAADLDKTEAYFHTLPVSTYAGEKAAWIERKAIRPKKVNVYYQREMEVMLDYEDNYSGNTSANPGRNTPFIENVCPTVDPETTIDSVYDPEINQSLPLKVPPGTYVNMRKLLFEWDKEKPDGSFPWTFETIRRHWVAGNLEMALGATTGADIDKKANVAMRVAAIRQHFRQTFRINGRYMSRVRSLRAVRVGVLDPVTGARAPAVVWGQACLVPSRKGINIQARGTEEEQKQGAYHNVDSFNSTVGGGDMLKRPISPARVSIIDEELGVFSLDWVADPYGTVGSIIPSLLVNPGNPGGVVPSRLLRKQDGATPMGPGMTNEDGANGLWLANKLEFAAVVTIVPSSPNNKKQFHKETIEPRDVQSLFQREFRIQNGEGPELHVYVSPGEATARFALTDEDAGRTGISEVLGLSGAPQTAGIEGPDVPGYTFTNREREIKPHAKSFAAELLTPFADNVQGTISTVVPQSGLKLVGNMAGASVRVSTGAKVDAVHQFPGQQRPISRYATMPSNARHLLLGTLVFST